MCAGKRSPSVMELNDAETGPKNVLHEHGSRSFIGDADKLQHFATAVFRVSIWPANSTLVHARELSPLSYLRSLGVIVEI